MDGLGRELTNRKTFGLEMEQKKKKGWNATCIGLKALLSSPQPPALPLDDATLTDAGLSVYEASVKDPLQ